MAKVGVIGGSGLYQMQGLEICDEVALTTPFGEPSCRFIIGKLEGADVVFLPRHGKGHKFSPGEINYRANIFGMKKLGVDAIISVSACGSLKQEIEPLHFVLPDQFVDRTTGRKNTFFTGGIVAHVALAQPTAPEIREVLAQSARDLGVTIHEGGTYFNMEGPQFSTRAESEMYRSCGFDVIGMTNATEAKLAREAEISYATLAAVTDYDCWHQTHETVSVDMIIQTLLKNVENARAVICKSVPRIAAMTEFSASDALKYAIITTPDAVAEDKKQELWPIIGKYMT